MSATDGGNPSQFRHAPCRHPIADSGSACAHSIPTNEEAARSRPRDTGDHVRLMHYLPTMLTTTFVLAAGLLLGYIH